ncbi:hypothetical protein BHM03_00010678 [Ensete ventricosum]|nr:hypothetical protein BHM03_00010678 [Ensete ventricosum]
MNCLYRRMSKTLERYQHWCYASQDPNVANRNNAQAFAGGRPWSTECERTATIGKTTRVCTLTGQAKKDSVDAGADGRTSEESKQHSTTKHFFQLSSLSASLSCAFGFILRYHQFVPAEAAIPRNPIGVNNFMLDWVP